jgi:hypothetical protein
MEIAQRTKFEAVRSEGRSHDVTILLGYAAFALVFLILIYLDSQSSGTTAIDFSTMTAFP